MPRGRATSRSWTGWASTTAPGSPSRDGPGRSPRPPPALDPGVERQAARGRRERREGPRPVADHRDAPGLQGVERGRDVEDRLDARADHGHPVGPGQLVEVGGDVEGGRGPPVDAPSPPVAITPRPDRGRSRASPRRSSRRRGPGPRPPRGPPARLEVASGSGHPLEFVVEQADPDHARRRPRSSPDGAGCGPTPPIAGPSPGSRARAGRGRSGSTQGHHSKTFTQCTHDFGRDNVHDMAHVIILPGKSSFFSNLAANFARTSVNPV